jgi:hypothetical protein
LRFGEAVRRRSWNDLGYVVAGGAVGTATMLVPVILWEGLG